jgi:hypothetical protein
MPGDLMHNIAHRIARNRVLRDDNGATSAVFRHAGAPPPAGSMGHQVQTPEHPRFL